MVLKDGSRAGLHGEKELNSTLGFLKTPNGWSVAGGFRNNLK